MSVVPFKWRRRKIGFVAAKALSTQVRYGAEHLPPSSRLVFRTGSGHPRYPLLAPLDAATTSPDQTQLAWVPQQLWAGVLAPWIADHDYRDRAAAAMMLAKIGSTRPWRRVVVDLGRPAGFAVHPPNLVRHLQHEGVRSGSLNTGGGK